MLRVARDLRHFARNTQDAARVVFIRAEPNDLESITGLCYEFGSAEPHSVALNFGREIAPIYESIAKNALCYPYSYKLMLDDKLVGVRLFSVSKLYEPYGDLSDVSPKGRILIELLQQLKYESSKQLPHVQTVLRREITFVKPELQRQGIARRLAHYGLDFAKLKESGVQGVISEASSKANQELLLKLGYRRIASIPESTYEKLGIKFHDGTINLQAFYKDIDELIEEQAKPSSR